MNHKEFIEFCKKNIEHLKKTDDGTADKIIEAARKGTTSKKKATHSSTNARV